MEEEREAVRRRGGKTTLQMDRVTGLSLRHSSWRKEERQTEEEAGRQHYKWTGLSLRHSSWRKEERQTEEEVGRQHYKWTIA